MQQEAVRYGVPARRGRKPAVRGPAAVRASLVAAAAELFAARGTAGVSVREIADRAGVNHGLIHHYYRSKQGLIDATLEALAAQASKALEDGLDLSPDEPLGRYLIVVSRALLEADDPSGAAGLAEIVGRLAELRSAALSRWAGAPLDPSAALAAWRGAGAPVADRAERLEAVKLAALLIGWLLFEPVLLEAAGLSGLDPGWARHELLTAALPPSR